MEWHIFYLAQTHVILHALRSKLQRIIKAILFGWLLHCLISVSRRWPIIKILFNLRACIPNRSEKNCQQTRTFSMMFQQKMIQHCNICMPHNVDYVYRKIKTPLVLLRKSGQMSQLTHWLLAVCHSNLVSLYCNLSWNGRTRLVATWWGSSNVWPGIDIVLLIVRLICFFRASSSCAIEYWTTKLMATFETHPFDFVLSFYSSSIHTISLLISRHSVILRFRFDSLSPMFQPSQCLLDSPANVSTKTN